MSKENDQFDFYKNEKKEWRWKRTAANNEIVGCAHEGYKNFKDCFSNAIRNGFVVDVHEWTIEE